MEKEERRFLVAFYHGMENFAHKFIHLVRDNQMWRSAIALISYGT